MKYSFKVPNKKSDFKFIKSCLILEDFISNISENISIHSNILIIRMNDEIDIGIFIPSILNISNIKHSRPIIYLLKEHRLYASITICKVIEYLFRNKKVDRVIIQVFSHNILMINCMNNLGIRYCGCIEKVRKIEDSFVSINFYDIDYKKYKQLESDFSD